MRLKPFSALEAGLLPADAVQIGSIGPAWGVQGWFKVFPHSASPEALFATKCWYLQVPGVQAPRSFEVKVNAQINSSRLLRISAIKAHAGGLVAGAYNVQGRTQAEALRGAHILISRSAFPHLSKDEYYWVDLLGLCVRNREGVTLGVVCDLLAAGPQTTLVVERKHAGTDTECLIPFVSAYVDNIDLRQKTIVVDWQLDY